MITFEIATEPIGRLPPKKKVKLMQFESKSWNIWHIIRDTFANSHLGRIGNAKKAYQSNFNVKNLRNLGFYWGPSQSQKILPPSLQRPALGFKNRPWSGVNWVPMWRCKEEQEMNG